MNKLNLPAAPGSPPRADDGARIETSSADTGSSSTMSRALVDRARAMANRWRWPPLTHGKEPGHIGSETNQLQKLSDPCT